MIRRGKALEIACWVVGTAMFTLYFDARFVEEIAREQGIEGFGQARTQAVTPYPNFVTPESFAWPEFPPLEAESVAVSFPPERVDFPVESRVAPPEWHTGSDAMPVVLPTLASVGLEVLVLESIAKDRNFPVTDISIVESGDTSSLFATDTAEGDLVTCYPFYFAGHAPQRYIICAMGD